MVDLSLIIEEESSLPPEEEAVRLKEQIERLKVEMEILSSRLDDAVKAAYASGIHVYGGYRFTVSKPSDTLSEKKMAECHPELMDRYIEWYAGSRDVKLTKTDLNKFLKEIKHTNPDQVLADITTPGKGSPTFKMIKEKGVDA